jgi:hypothetical protein
MYSGLKRRKRHRRLAARIKMELGTKKMEDDEKQGRGYTSGICMRGEGETEADCELQKPKRKKAKLNNGRALTSTQRPQCKCGAGDHQRVNSKNCPWRGLSKKDVARNYELRLNELKKKCEGASELCEGASSTLASSTGPTMDEFKCEGVSELCEGASSTLASSTGPTMDEVTGEIRYDIVQPSTMSTATEPCGTEPTENPTRRTVLSTSKLLA